MDVDLKARLLMGLDISIHDITIKNYKMGTLFKDVGLSRYLQLSSLAIRTPKDFLQEEFLEEFKSVTMFDVFCINDELNNFFIQFLNLFTGYEWTFITTPSFTEFHAINEYGSRVHIGKGNYDDVIEIIKVMYCLDRSKRESERDDIDERMKEILAEFEEEESRVNSAKGGTITLISIIDGIANKHNSINLLNIWEYTMYQVMHTFHSLEKISNEDRVMNGVYAGMIDSKKIDLEKMHWAAES